jgi:hypothetical protein
MAQTKREGRRRAEEQDWSSPQFAERLSPGRSKQRQEKSNSLSNRELFEKPPPFDHFTSFSRFQLGRPLTVALSSYAS